MNRTTFSAFAVALLVCSTPVLADDAALKSMLHSFQPEGQATLERLYQDETQSTCSTYRPGKPIPKAVSGRIEKINMQMITYPAKLMGDWRSGERIAQSGIGMQYSDDYKRGAGANCYACHQLSPQELSFGTIGPSLRNFGKQRGTSEAIVKYTYGKIYNAHAYSACTNMPRFGANGILTQAQIADLTALLLDPESPVNK